MTTPQRGLLFHFTHLANLSSIATGGLRCDSRLADDGYQSVEVGNQTIKKRRRSRTVPVAPGGVVADYVPFYFAARSPMMYVISKGAVPTYDQEQEGLIYLVTSIETLVRHGAEFLFTDRNATLEYATFEHRPKLIDSHIDWDLMEARMWQNTGSDPDRMERRMAECLVHRRVPWAYVERVVARNAAVREKAGTILAEAGVSNTVTVEPDWYF